MADKILDSLLHGDEIMETPIDPRNDLLNEIEDYQNEIQSIQSGISTVKATGLSPVTNVDCFSELGDLTTRAVAVLDACKSDIERSSLLDADLIASYASLIKSTREIISEYMTVYRDRQTHINRMELEDIKQNHRKEILQNILIMCIS